MTPQGGVISPLLSNVFLHWFETCANIIAKGTGQAMTIVRYADDFVILAREWREGFRQKVEEAIEGRFGLVVNRDKTRCVDMKSPHESLAFLGYEFRLFPSKRWKGTKFLWYGPAKSSVKKIRDKVKALTLARRGPIPVEDVLHEVNQTIDGWGRYFRCGHPSERFAAVNYYAFSRMRIWMRRRRLRIPRSRDISAMARRMAGRILSSNSWPITSFHRLTSRSLDICARCARAFPICIRLVSFTVTSSPRTSFVAKKTVSPS